MSRYIIYKSNRLEVASGNDIMMGKFFQIFDKELEHETPEGEGLVYDWDERHGTSTNYTGISTNLSPEDLIHEYIVQTKNEDDMD